MARIVVPAQPKEGKTLPTKEFLLKSGTHTARDEDGNLVEYVPGDLVPLTEIQYANFSDKFQDPDEAQRWADEQRKLQQDRLAQSAGEGGNQDKARSR